MILCFYVLGFCRDCRLLGVDRLDFVFGDGMGYVLMLYWFIVILICDLLVGLGIYIFVVFVWIGCCVVDMFSMFVDYFTDRFGLDLLWVCDFGCFYLIVCFKGNLCWRLAFSYLWLLTLLVICRFLFGLVLLLIVLVILVFSDMLLLFEIILWLWGCCWYMQLLCLRYFWCFNCLLLCIVCLCVFWN